MHLKLNSLALAGAVVLGLATSAAQAAPMLGTQEPQAGNGTETIAYRCWWAYGERHCAYFDDGGRYYRYRSSPDDYPTGSRGWWREMDRDGRAGRPGG